jgi:hypothetical protein
MITMCFYHKRVKFGCLNRIKLMNIHLMTVQKFLHKCIQDIIIESIYPIVEIGEISHVTLMKEVTSGCNFD